MAEEQERPEITNGVYRGRTWQRVSKNGANMYKLMFSPTIDSDKTFSFKCSEKARNFDTLEEGKEYSIGYFVDEPYTNKAGIRVTNSKTAVFFGEPRDDARQQGNSSKNNNVDINGFVKTYKDKVRDSGEKPNFEHALGSMLVELMSDKPTVQQFRRAWDNIE